jgi:hypothetical protein
MPQRHTSWWLGALATGAVLVYLVTTTGLADSLGKLVLLPVFAIGPFAMLGVLMLADHLGAGGRTLPLRLATVFLLVGFVLFTLMVIVQQTVVLQFHEFRRAAPDAATVASLQQVFRGVNLVQQGIDVAFDVFYCLGVIVLAAVMYRHRDFGRFTGAFGIVAAAGLLVLNVWAFPYVPAESGLIDLGPVTAVWWVLIIFQLIRARRRADGR